VLRGLVDVAVAAPLFAFAPLYRPWHLRWDATDAEVAAAMPGDALVSEPSLICGHPTTHERVLKL
jgi:hypothetical protein